MGRKHTQESKNKISENNSRFWLGKKMAKKHRKNLSVSHIGIQKGSKNPLWKGDNAGYMAMHLWVAKWKGRPNKCEMCGQENKKKYEWANIDHEYKRILDDYIRLCTSCHRKYDNLNNPKKHEKI